jgi:hypothetical protein
MPKARKTIPPKTLAAENAAITQFLFDVALPAPGVKLPLQEVFEAYENWRQDHELPPSKLNIDGFGRLFPKAYPRRSAYWAGAGHALKCVFNLGLKNA